jgi:hypothetical protein
MLKRLASILLIVLQQYGMRKRAVEKTLVAIEARAVVASVETYLKYAEAIGLGATAA